MKKIIVGITGASGVIYGIRLLEILNKLKIETHLILTNSATKVLKHETDYKEKEIISLATHYHDENNIAASLASGSFKNKQPPDIKGTGFVVESLESALWALYTTDNFKDGALKAVNLGDDADSTGAVYGQIAGACYDIHKEWLNIISMKEKIIEISNLLYSS